jgi:plasmid stabilization system protein ParE
LKLRITVQGHADLRALHRFVEASDAAAADAALERVLDVMGMLQEMPRMGRPGRVVGTRELVVTGTAFLIAYEINNVEVRVLRVLHGRMQWPEAF